MIFLIARNHTSGLIFWFNTGKCRFKALKGLNLNNRG